MTASAPPEQTDHFLDITGDVCPMTFVRTRLLIEKMKSDETATVRLVGEEPLENVPASVTELGHDVLSLTAEGGGDAGPDAVHLLVLRKA